MKDYYDTGLEQSSDRLQVQATWTGVYRSCDSNLSDEPRRTIENTAVAKSAAISTLYAKNGSLAPTEKAHLSVADGEARLCEGLLVAPDHATEDALLSKVGDQAPAKVVDRLSVFVPDDNQSTGRPWSRHDFQPMTDRDPGLSGIV